MTVTRPVTVKTDVAGIVEYELHDRDSVVSISGTLERAESDVGLTIPHVEDLRAEDVDGHEVYLTEIELDRAQETLLATLEEDQP